MLTGDLVKPRLKQRGDRLTIQTVDANAHWRLIAEDLLILFEQHLGQQRAVWESSLEGYIGDSLDYLVMRGMAKVLCDNATFSAIDTPLPPTEARERLFAQGPVFSKPDIFQPNTRRDVLRATAKQLRTSQKKLNAALFADRPSEYLLTDLGGSVGEAWTAHSLIGRYNLELTRGVLYWANTLQVELHDTYKDFWRYVKLFKLMFWASPLENDDGYLVQLDGPISPFFKASKRYGRQFASFLPALYLCEQWQMVASVQSPRRNDSRFLEFRLDDSSPLHSHFKRSGAYDSKLEANFAAEFASKFGDERGEWVLQREDEVLLLGDTVMIPDFSFTNKQDGRRALVEIMGFWHPQYLRLKLEKVRNAGRNNLILLVYEDVKLGDDTLDDLPSAVLFFKRKPVLKDVMAMVELVAE